MDLRKTADADKVVLCRKYFFLGLLALPFLWVVNVVWFFKHAFKREAYEQQKDIRKYVTYSGIGAAIWVVILSVWITIFQLNRASWGETGDALSFNIPRGIP